MGGNCEHLTLPGIRAWTSIGMSKTILIADDEEFIVDLLAALLEDEEYRILRAYDGEQALAAIQRERPQLIITDIMMPKMSGTELAIRLRALEHDDHHTPIILMSAVSNPLTIPNTIYLPKPFDIDHVLELVALLLS
jgi:CheY-like chemotaxis protein